MIRSFYFRTSLLVLMAGVLGAVPPALAGELLVKVVDENGAPVPGVAVVMESHRAETNAPTDSAPNAVMDQRDEQFVPALLVVRAGTTVEFPNSDDVMHHVYSFSATKTFEIPLYQHHPPSPVQFDRPGLVVVGCNIHDQMIGHILVVESPYFGVTDAQGTARLPHGSDPDSEVVLWHPGMGGFEHAVRQPVSGPLMEVRLTSDPRRPPNPDDGALSWNDY